MLLVVFFQHLSDISFLKTELLYLASPYYDFNGIAKSLVFLFSYTAAVLLLWTCIHIQSRLFWQVVFIFIVLFMATDIFIQLAVNERGFTKFEYAVALVERNSYKNMLVFSQEALISFFYAFLFSLVLVLCRKKTNFRIPAAYFLIFSLFAFAAIYGAKQWVYYIKYPSYPAVVKIPLIMIDYHVNAIEEQPRVLKDNITPVSAQATNENIVWIIDESIGGQYLSLNGFEKETTPYLSSLQGTQVMANFGVVNSVANCSAFSNLMMRVGLSSHTKGADADYIKTRTELPTIYQYAKRAGYKTWLLDAQADEGQLQNYLTPHDMQSIDHYITLDTRTVDYMRDRILLTKIVDALADDPKSKNFIVFVKDGAHWPYLWRYPHDKQVFFPGQGSIYEEKTLANKDKLINTYSNVVKYAVDDFLLEYLERVDLETTLTFYTSDHGQNLLDEGAKTPLTHCTIGFDAPVSQSMVPLIIFGDNVGERFPVKEDRVYSQYQIFPTLLNLMGYDENVVSDYGQNLLEGQSLSSKRWFYFGMEGDKVPFILEE